MSIIAFNIHKFALIGRGGLVRVANYCTNGNFLQYDKDPGPHFIKPETQTLLQSMTRLQLEKIFRKRTVPQNDIEYKFLSTEELETEINQSVKRAKHLLQMPPICQIKATEPKVLSQDPALTDFDTDGSTYVFTDITFGVRDTDRVVVLRQPDGTLETAPAEVRKRVSQIYFPHDGRKIRMPRMFEEANLQTVLDNFEYEFILDRMCVQFEPYENEFHTISSKVYQHVNENKRFDDLRSTRHFGPLAFFLAWHKIIDDLLIDMIKRDYLKNGVELIALMRQLNSLPTSAEDQVLFKRIASYEDSDIDTFNDSEDVHEKLGKSRAALDNDDACLAFIEKYIKEEGVKKVQLDIVVQGFKESHKQQQTLLEGLEKAHGVS